MPSTTAATTATQLVSITTALLASGGIAALSLFDVPELQSQPASRSLPSIRWLFSRGSHIFPQAAFLSSAGFAYLAYEALPRSQKSITSLLRFGANGPKVNGFLVAAALALSIGPVTSLMIPTNFTLIKMNEERGGTRSERSAREGNAQPGDRSAVDSVNSKGEAAEFTDLSGPQARTQRDSTREDDERVKQLLDKFALMNGVRAVLIGAGGLIGLWAALL